MCAFLLCLAPSPLQAQAGRSTILTVLVKGSDTGRGVRSNLARSPEPGAPRFPTAGDGRGRIDLGSCDTLVQIVVYPDYGYSGTTEAVQCSPNVVELVVEPNSYAQAMTRAFGDLAQSASIDPEINLLRGQLSGALATGTPASVAVLARQLAAAYRASDPALAASYNALAVEAGQRALAPSQWQLNMDDHLRLDPSGEGITLTPSARRDLQRFQRESQIPTTGRWDRRTFEAMQRRMGTAAPGGE